MQKPSLSSSSLSHQRRPSIYEEAMEMLAGAMIIYIFADIREMVRQRNNDKEKSVESTLGLLSISDLEPPITLEYMVNKIQENAQALAERAIDHEDLKKRLETLHSIRLAAAANQNQNDNQNIDNATDTSGSIRWSSLLNNFSNLRSTSTSQRVTVTTSSTKIPSILLTNFEDERANEEVVHAIVVNEARGRITVIYRGSVTQKDFIQDAKCVQKKVENPVAQLHHNRELTTETFSVHSGFHQYLFKVHKETGKARLETVLEEVKEQLRLHPGFRVFFAGHSLGAALATMSGFYAASEEDIILRTGGQSVVVYSVASPFVGNWKFRHAFQELERRKRLQHLRIANLEDMVTLLPFCSPKVTVLSPALSAVFGAGNLYKHCGMRLQFRGDPVTSVKDKGEGSDRSSKKNKTANPKEPSFSVSFPKDKTNDEEYAKEVNDAMEAGKSLASAFYYLLRKDFDKLIAFHSCKEYEQRLEMHKAELMKITLDDLYEDKALVGDVLNQDYEPSKLPGAVARASRAFQFWRGAKEPSKTSSTEVPEGDSV